MVPHILKKAEIWNNEACRYMQHYFSLHMYMQVISMSQILRLWRTLKTHIFSVFVSKGRQVYSELRLMCLRVDISSIIIPVHSSAHWIETFSVWGPTTQMNVGLAGSCFQLRWLHKGPAQNNYEWFLHNAKLPFYSRVEQLPFKTIRVVFCLCVRVMIVVYCRLFYWQRTG